MELFFVTGKGKLLNLDKTGLGCSRELGLPFPKLNAVLAGSTECFRRFAVARRASVRASFPSRSRFTMLVAYLTADPQALVGIFSEPDKFLGASPFLFC